jgi:hypothetical protein
MRHMAECTVPYTHSIYFSGKVQADVSREEALEILYTNLAAAVPLLEKEGEGLVPKTFL